MEPGLSAFIHYRPFRAFVIYLVDGRQHVVFDPNRVQFGSWIEGASGVMIDLSGADEKTFEFIAFESIVCIAPDWRYSPKWKPALN